MMAVTGSLQLSRELGIYKNHKYRSQFKRVDTLSFHLLDSVNRPIRCVPSRYNIFMCRSCLTPAGASGVPVLKTAAAALTRSYDAFHGSPLVRQFVPALGIIAFAVWGLAPLIRHSRNIIFHRSDSSWRSSRTHHVTTSYVQPLLLWSGAILICRALDPVVLTTPASQAVKQRLIVFVRSLSTVLAVAYCLSSFIQQTQKFFTETNDSKDTRNMGFQFAGKALYTAVWVAAVSLFMELLGFSTQKWLTAGGLGTVLLTLAGREIFTNFLSSLMIHATRPFVLNEWIQTKIEGYEVSGTVEHVGWWSPTIVRGDDREAVHIPNHKFTVNVVRNLSQKTHWRIKTHLAISHLDVNKINIIVADMRKVLSKNPQVEQQKLHRRVFLENINPENQALMVLISCFVKTSHFEEYLCVKETILLDLLRVISHHRARLATPIRTIHKVHSDADMENIPFSETIYSRARPASNRPFILIEPPYKINGEEKTKSQPRPARTNEEQENKVAAATAASDSKANKVTADAQIPADAEADNKVAVKPITEPKEGMDAESKAEAEAAARTSSNSKADPNVAATSPESKNVKRSESKAGNKAVTNSSLDLKLEPVVATSSPDQRSAQKNSYKQAKNVSSGDSKVEEVPLSRTASVSSSKSSQLEGLDSMGLNSSDLTLLGAAMKKSPGSSSDTDTNKAESVPLGTSHGKKESERPASPPQTTRSSLEDNIVLGVALEGSKRTLPIEEEGVPSPTSAETKEFAAIGNRNGSSSVVKDKKKDKKDDEQRGGQER